VQRCAVERGLGVDESRHAVGVNADVLAVNCASDEAHARHADDRLCRLQLDVVVLNHREELVEALHEFLECAAAQARVVEYRLAPW
jgi:hypothetical protein